MSPRVRPRLDQPGWIRLAHWLNLPLLALMAGSGLQILAAFPYLGPRGAPYRLYPLQGQAPPEWARWGGWLAGARTWHFALAWLLVGNGALYLAYLLATGEWRRRAFRPRDLADARDTARHYLRLQLGAPPRGLYNGLQKLAYTSALVLGLLEVLSGLAIYKPVQLSWLAAAFGGYDGARAVHLLALAGLCLFTLGHVLMVLLHPRTLLTMLTGGPRRVPGDT